MQRNNSSQTPVLACYSWAYFWSSSSNVTIRPREHRWTTFPILANQLFLTLKKPLQSQIMCVPPLKKVSPTIRSMFPAWEIKQTTNKQHKALGKKVWPTPETYIFVLLFCFVCLHYCPHENAARRCLCLQMRFHTFRSFFRIATESRDKLHRQMIVESLVSRFCLLSNVRSGRARFATWNTR